MPGVRQACRIERERVDEALEIVTGRLLAARAPEGYWAGELSSSALSTAVSAFALSYVERQGGPARSDLVEGGLDWLARHANPDGGWGDTVRSRSNLSTTALSWAALSAVPGGSSHRREALERAETWIRGEAGSLDPKALLAAVRAAYGEDRTFSVPILMVCALAGRLGTAPEAWDLVPQLPFELAAFPRACFKGLRLQVVSYALPALIAVGLARHRRRPSRNPVIRSLRSLASARTLHILGRIQPSDGGFLEATPLTAFVTLGLAASGERGHGVLRKGFDFLVRSVRADGSWPIDTNLSTWLTTLAVNALEGEGLPAGAGAGLDRASIREWLLAQQHREVHAYTGAAPGGWAWTDLPGGVPDADDTSGALLALRRLGPREPGTREAVALGVRWLLDLQNQDGGLPTFCRGWGMLPFDRSSPDLTAHALRAWNAWKDEVGPSLAARARKAIRKGVAYLRRAQHEDGAWTPLWFGNEQAPGGENRTYGTARVLAALRELEAESCLETAALERRGAEWLLRAQGADGGWGGSPGAPPSVEETALGVEALAGSASLGRSPEVRRAARGGLGWLLERVEQGLFEEPSPIGFYFAKLWYFERLYPLVFTVAALTKARDRAAVWFEGG